jgi:hypothetical protein
MMASRMVLYSISAVMHTHGLKASRAAGALDISLTVRHEESKIPGLVDASRLHVITHVGQRPGKVVTMQGQQH